MSDQDASFRTGMQVRREMFGPAGAEERLHTSVYAGIPAGVEAFGAAAEALPGTRGTTP